MPFVKWSVTPVCLSKKPLSSCDSPPASVGAGSKPRGAADHHQHELTTTSNVTLVHALRQLASVVQIAHHIFTEVSDECGQVHQRAERLKKRIAQCHTTVAGLNAKTVQVPVGDLTKFSQLTDHYKSRQPEDEAVIFGPETRPRCIRNLYNNAAATPVHIIRTIDQYRQDGRTGSKIFMCMPVIADKCDLADIETRRPASVLVVPQQSTNRGTDEADDASEIVPAESRVACEISAPSPGGSPHHLVRLPSPEEQMHALSLEYPASVVPIDVTGSNLQRMSAVRRSLIHVDFFIRRKKKKKAKRRNTISEGGSKEIRQALQNQSLPHSKSDGDQPNAKAVEKVNNSCQTEVEVEVHKYCRFLPLRRSFRRKSIAMSPEREENNNNVSTSSSLDAKHSKSKDDVASLYESVDLKASKEWKPVRVKGVKKAEELTGNKSSKQESGEGVKKLEKTSNRNKGRSYIPISTVSAAMTVAVKMRETMTRSSSKNGGEDGRSSSGNWSAGSSSNRASIDSDNHRAVAGSTDIMSHSHSDSSIGKDSVISDNTQMDTDGRSQDGTLTGYLSDTSAAATAVTIPSKWRPSSLVARQVTALDTDTWLQSLDQSDGHSSTLTPDYLSDSASTPLVLSPYLYRRGANNTDTSHASMDDGESSVYSVDTDGYYTSMHTDSGLKTHSLKYNFSSIRGHARRGSESSVGTLDNSSLNSVLSRTATEPSSNCSTLTKKAKVPPPPPPRVSSAKKEENNTKTSSDAAVKDEKQAEKEKAPSRSHSPSPTTTNGSTSESEQEVAERLREKTEINSSRYPSMCAVSPIPSEDETARSEKSASDAAKSLPSDAERNKSEASHTDNAVDKTPPTDSAKVPSTPTREPTPPKINMYGDQSPQKSKFVTLVADDPVTEGKNSESSSERPPSMSSFSPTSHKEFIPTSPDNRAAVPDGPSAPAREYHTPVSMLPPEKDASNRTENSIPLKYTHHITITPRARVQTSMPSDHQREHSPNPSASPTHVQKFVQSTFHPTSRPFPARQNGYASPVRSPSSPIHQPPPVTNSGPPQIDRDHGTFSPPPPNDNGPPMSPRLTSSTPVPNANRPVARVTLDPEGRVIYMSNSLGRRRDGHPLNCTSPTSPTEASGKFATLPMYHPRMNSSVSQSPGSTSSVSMHQQEPPPRPYLPDNSPYSSCGSSARIYGSVARPPTPAVYMSPSNLPGTRPYYNPPPQLPNSQAVIYQKPEYSNLGDSQMNAANAERGLQNNTPPVGSPARVPYGSPSRTCPSVNGRALAGHNQRPHDLHLQNSLSPSSSAPIYATPKKLQNGSKGPEMGESIDDEGKEKKKQPMTTEDLFAVIHNSKKKHNIKTDLEISPSPHSSRSSSPCGRPLTPSRSVLAETGFLSPRNAQNSMAARDRQSWACDPRTFGSSNVPGERRSLANDRLGPVKPTSMHDFKMLLLQARRTTASPGERRSAAELLQATTPRNASSLTMNGAADVSSPCESPGPQSLPTSPTRSLSPRDTSTAKPSWNGHSTVPLKRGVRARSSLQNRCDLMLYPPIMEEDTEASRDLQRSPRINPSQPLFVQNSKTSAITGRENGYVIPPGISGHDDCTQSTSLASNGPAYRSSSTWV